MAGQRDAGAPGLASQLPLLVLASGLHDPDDLYLDGDRLLAGEHATGRIAVLDSEVDQLPGSVPLVEGIARIGPDLYVADQQADRIVVLRTDGQVQPFFQLSPVRGVDGVDGIATDGRVLIVPDSARGQVLWIGTDARVQRTASGFARPTGAWPMPDGSVLVADENAGRVYRLAADGTRSVVASGLGLVDDVAAAPDGRIFAINLTAEALVEVGRGALVSGFDQVQGLAVDHAGNPIVSELGRGRVVAAVTSFKALPPGDPPALAPGQTLCVRLARAPGFADPVEIADGPGYHVVRQPASGSEGEVLAQACGQPSCTVGVTLRSGDRRELVRLRYRAQRA